MDNAEVGLVFELAGLLELGVCALLLGQLVHEALVCGLGEPALLVQQGQHPRGVSLGPHQRRTVVRDHLETGYAEYLLSCRESAGGFCC